MKTIQNNNIESLVNTFIEGRKPDERYSSFDYCYNYFYSFYLENKISDLGSEKYLEISCYKLGFYLASWGMMRGSSFLLSKSVAHFKNLIISVSKMPKDYWEIDLDNYTEENINKLLEIKNIIKNDLGIKNNASDTLITKIMLGIFGNIPAFDRYFKNGLGVGIVNKINLKKINSVYTNNKKELDEIKIKTLNFSDGLETNIYYTKAKIIDMYGFEKGFINLK